MSAAGYLLNKREGYNPSVSEEIAGILNNFGKSYIFHQTIPGYEPTPLCRLEKLADLIGVGNIIVKDESQRFGTNALKMLGASFAVHEKIHQQNKAQGFCSATDGNHGRALAWACRQNNINCVIFVPSFTRQSRIRYIEEEGALVIVSTGNYDQAVKEAEAFATSENYTLIQDTSWDNYSEIPAIITSGYYTQMHELMEQSLNMTDPQVDIIFLQAGVGSWPSAIVHFIRKYLQNNQVKIVCVEPFESDAIYESMKMSRLATTQKSQQTIMAGLNCGTPSQIAYEILKEGIDAFLIIDDAYAIDAIKYLNAPLPGDPYIASGESGSAGLAGLLAVMHNDNLKELRKTLNLNKQSSVLVFNTENVTDPELFNQILTMKTSFHFE